MTLFFLNQRLRSDYIRDEEGAHFGSLEEARQEAIGAARDAMARMVLTGCLDLDGAFEIKGPEGPSVIVAFSEALTIMGK
jgi:hypothetical protein